MRTNQANPYRVAWSYGTFRLINQFYFKALIGLYRGLTSSRQVRIFCVLDLFQVFHKENWAFKTSYWPVSNPTRFEYLKTWHISNLLKLKFSINDRMPYIGRIKWISIRFNYRFTICNFFEKLNALNRKPLILLKIRKWVTNSLPGSTRVHNYDYMVFRFKQMTS